MVNVNITATQNLIEATKHLALKAFINTGSSSEYGIKRRPMGETDSLDTTTFYGATKAAGTLLARAYAVQNDLPIVTVRPFSVYGPGDAPDKFIPSLIRAAKTKDSLPLTSGVHDWIWVEDYVDAMLLVARSAAELRGKAINIGTGIQTSNHALVSMVRSITGRPVHTKPVDSLRVYDTNESWVADISTLTKMGWRWKIGVEQGLTRLLYEQGII